MIAAGTTNVGLILSLTVITWVAVVKLPQLSVTLHVLVIIWEPSQGPAAVASLYVTTGEVVQLSCTLVGFPVTSGNAL